MSTMKIVLDLQSLQTESRYRGIGRYSLALARAMITEGKRHEFLIALNHAFPETVDAVRQAFADLLPPENIALFKTPTPVGGLDRNQWRCQAAELVREHFLEQLRPDWVHVSTLFEGLGDNAVTSIGRFADLPTAVTLYDLIPYCYPEHYLANPVEKTWYMRKLEHLRKAELLLAISEYTRREAIELLGLPTDRVVNISTDADARFRVLQFDQEAVQALRVRYGLSRDFVMYTGGIQYRKNVEGLIQAYAGLPAEVRAGHQLVVCCKVQDYERRRLEGLAYRLGLAKDEMVLTGYVSDEDLVMLYNLCKLFVFPPLAEGFGLPALEAMRCGAPVIGSDSTSIPEVVGLEEALFDPTSINSMHDKLHEALTDDQFRQRLREHGRLQAGEFSWSATARRALEALEAVHERRQHAQLRNKPFSVTAKPWLAYISPLPPEKSGIADYSAELLPELAHYYDIDLITDLKDITDPRLVSSFRRRSVAEFRHRAREYERVLYQFGNSTFHSHMFPLLTKYPGTVVLHDFFLSGILHYLEATASGPVFRQALYRSHGYPALQLWHSKGAEEADLTYPCCLEVLQSAQGVIVHSEHALRLAEQFFSLVAEGHLVKIPSLRRLPEKPDRAASRQALGLSNDAFMVCSFGIVHPTKLDDRLLGAWLSSDLGRDERCCLVFVGDGQRSPYEEMLRQQVSASGSGGRVKITGYADAETYRHYLAAADVAVQLRTLSRGETSRSILDCLAHGLSTVVNSHGSLAELPSDAVVKLPDDFTDAELTAVLEQLYHDPARHEALGQAAMDYVRKHLNPAQIARQYAEAIESFAESHPVAKRHRLLSAIVALPVKPAPRNDNLAQVAAAIAENALPFGRRHLFVDVTRVVRHKDDTDIYEAARGMLQQLLVETPSGLRVEPVYCLKDTYRYARRFMARLLGLGEFGLDDAPVDVAPGDIFLRMDIDTDKDETAISWLQYHAQRGLKLFSALTDLLPVLKAEYSTSAAKAGNSRV
jgi:glycosyltransferase involved in cell wall biosynthesis